MTITPRAVQLPADENVLVFQTGETVTPDGRLIAARLLADCSVQIYDSATEQSHILVDRVNPRYFCAGLIARAYYLHGTLPIPASDVIAAGLRAAVADALPLLSIRREVNR